MTIPEDELAEALDGFWLHVACGGQRVHGQVANPDEVASVLLATLGRIAAERDAAPALLVAAAVDRAEAAEAKLAEVAAYVREHKGNAGFSWVHALDILAITGEKADA